MELLTEKQEARKKRDAEVSAAYREMRRKYPNASRTRIINELAKQKIGGLTSYFGVRSALQNRGVL